MNCNLNDVFYVGVNDRKIDLFEGLYKVPDGVSYNSYLILDDKIAVMDTVDEGFGDEWIAKIEQALSGRAPDYLIVQHMEPDHSANVLRFARTYPTATIVGNAKTFVMLSEYFGNDFADRRLVVTDGYKLELGLHTLTFVFAPMVHWPEVMLTYDGCNKALFSADAFGKFGVPDADGDWIPEARRYYFGIVGKYGKQVVAALKKLSAYDIQAICPLHGPVLDKDIGKYLALYTKWASYQAEENGVMIAYNSVYGHTEKVAFKLRDLLSERGVKNVIVRDLIRDDRSECVAEAFAYSTLVLASTTYNAGVFPAMREFIDCLKERNYQNRAVAFIGNGTWAPVADNLMRTEMEKCANLNLIEPTVKIRSTLNGESLSRLEILADKLAETVG